MFLTLFLIIFQLKIKDVHIRYEDAITVPGQVFALGVTIRSLTAQSCDDKWIPRFVGWDSGETSFKLMELSTLAVYWDKLTDDQLLGRLSLGELAVSIYSCFMKVTCSCIQVGHSSVYLCRLPTLPRGEVVAVMPFYDTLFFYIMHRTFACCSSSNFTYPSLP
jgi:hypothetical protein